MYRVNISCTGVYVQDSNLKSRKYTMSYSYHSFKKSSTLVLGPRKESIPEDKQSNQKKSTSSPFLIPSDLVSVIFCS